MTGKTRAMIDGLLAKRDGHKESLIAQWLIDNPTKTTDDAVLCEQTKHINGATTIRWWVEARQTTVSLTPLSSIQIK